MRISDKQVYTFTYNLIYLMMGRDGAFDEITQEEFAKKLGVAQSTVSSWIRAEKFPREKTLNKIADEFNVTVDELLNVQLNFVDMKQMGIDIPDEMEEQDPYAEWREMLYQRDEYFDALIEAVDSGGVFDIAKHPILANLLSRKSIPKDLNKVVALYKKLTPEGQKKVLSYASDLSENPKYRRDNDGNAET